MAVSNSGTRVLFNQAVSSVFKEWQALRIAVDNMFGGPMSKEKALWLEEVTADFVSNNADVQKWELEDYISTIMEQEFSTQVDDASLPEISRKICDLYSLCMNGNTAKVKEYIERSKPAEIVEVQCLSQESLGEDEASDILEDIMEEDNEMAKEDTKPEEEDVRLRLDQVHISSLEESSPSLVTNNQCEEREHMDSENIDDGEWEVVKKSRRKSRSKHNN